MIVTGMCLGVIAMLLLTRLSPGSSYVGGSVGTALLSTVLASSAAAFASSHADTPGLQAAATVHGYTTAFWWAAGIFAVGVVIAPHGVPGRHSTRAAARRPLDGHPVTGWQVTSDG